MCGYPYASKSDVEAWGQVEQAADMKAYFTLGLFSYDISCIVNQCAIVLDSNAYCSFIEARGIDGLALGTQLTASTTAADNPDGGYYYLGFRYPESGDLMVKGNHAQFYRTHHFLGNYEVTADLLDNEPEY